MSMDLASGTSDTTKAGCDFGNESHCLITCILFLL